MFQMCSKCNRIAIFHTLLTLLSALLVLGWYNIKLDLNQFAPARNSNPSKDNRTAVITPILIGKPTITVAVVACESSLSDALTMMTSLVMFSRDVDLDLRIFQNNISQTELLTHLGLLETVHWKQNGKFTFRIHNVSFPDPFWYPLFKPCATQRIFLSHVLPDVDSLMYVDTDVLFLSSANELWKHFLLMNGTQMVAMGPDGLPPSKSMYSFSKVPYYAPRGLNSGVLLMNLTRMRQMDSSNEMRLIYEGYKKLIKYHDQDLLNIYFHFHPQWLYVLPCEFNYAAQFCHCTHGKPGSCNCRNAESSGIAVLHGSNKQFHSKENPLFGQIYDTFAKFNLSKQQPGEVLTLLRQRHKNLQGRCSQLELTIYKKIEKYI